MTRKKGSRAGHVEHARARGPARHPHGVATIALPDEVDDILDQPFAEGPGDQLDPDLRHRLISEAAYHRQAERGYNEGYDREDWLDAEAEVDHWVVGPKTR